MPDVGEHDAEHDHVGHAGDQRRVQIRVRHGRISLDQRRELSRGTFLREHGRRVDAARAWHGDYRGASALEPSGQPMQLLGRHPTGHRGHPPPRHGLPRAVLELRFARDQIDATGLFPGIKIGLAGGERRCDAASWQPL